MIGKGLVWLQPEARISEYQTDIEKNKMVVDFKPKNFS
jgi:hypothetical protein